MLLDVVAGQLPSPVLPRDGQSAVRAEGGDGPGVAVGDARSLSLRRVLTRSPTPIRCPAAW